MTTTKMGRPTEALKNHVVRLRVDDATLEKLNVVCKEKQLTYSEFLRSCILKSYSKIKTKK